MSINPAALLPSQISKPATTHSTQPQHQPVTADLDQPAHVQPLHSVVKVQLNCLDYSMQFVSRSFDAALLACKVNCATAAC